MTFLFILSLQLKNYTEPRFAKLSSTQLAFGLFFTASWCEECQESESQMAEFAGAAFEVFSILRVDCANLTQRDLCVEHKIKKVPAFILMNHIPDNKPVLYTSAYTRKELELFVREYMNTPLHVSSHPAALLRALRQPPEERDRPIVIFFTKGSVAPWFAYRAAIKYFAKATFMHQVNFTEEYRAELKETPLVDQLASDRFNCVVKLDNAFYYYGSHEEAFSSLDRWLRGLIGRGKDFV